jgi:hypothetical protein
MSTAAAPMWGKDTALTRRAGEVLEQLLEPEEAVELATPAIRGRISMSLLISVPGALLAWMIAGRWNASALTFQGTAVYFLGFMTAIMLGTKYGLRPRVLVLTDRRFILCHQTYWRARPTDRIDVAQRRDAISTTWRTSRRFALKDPAGKTIKIRLRAGTKIAAAIKDWTEIPPSPIPPNEMRAI